MVHWRKPPPETEETCRMGSVTLGEGFGAMGGIPLGPGEAQAFYWWISLPFRILFFVLRLIVKGFIKLIGSKGRSP